MDNLLASIMTKITTGPSSLYNDVGGRVFLDCAPDDNPDYPYVVFLIVVDTPDNSFQKNGEEVAIQFSLFSASSSVTEISTMYTDLKALFDDVKLTVTGSTMVIMKRERLVTMTEEIVTELGTQKGKHWAVDYTATLQTN